MCQKTGHCSSYVVIRKDSAQTHSENINILISEDNSCQAKWLAHFYTGWKIEIIQFHCTQKPVFSPFIRKKIYHEQHCVKIIPDVQLVNIVIKHWKEIWRIWRIYLVLIWRMHGINGLKWSATVNTCSPLACAVHPASCFATPVRWKDDFVRGSFQQNEPNVCTRTKRNNCLWVVTPTHWRIIFKKNIFVEHTAWTTISNLRNMEPDIMNGDIVRQHCLYYQLEAKTFCFKVYHSAWQVFFFYTSKGKLRAIKVSF